MKVTSAGFQVLSIPSLFVLVFCPAANGAMRYFPCPDGLPCVEQVTDTCDEIVLNYDFMTNGCCFSLSSDDNGGCLISVEGNSPFSLETCGRIGRLHSLTVGDNVGEISGVPGDYIAYGINGTSPDVCPPSDYTVETGFNPFYSYTATMTLYGVTTAWTEQDTNDWAALTANYSATFFVEFPEFGYRDVLTYIQVYPNGGATWDEETGQVTLIYLQGVSFRVARYASYGAHVTGADMLQTAFNTVGFEMMYLDALKTGINPTLAAVESISGFVDLEI